MELETKIRENYFAITEYEFSLVDAEKLKFSDNGGEFSF